MKANWLLPALLSAAALPGIGAVADGAPTHTVPGLGMTLVWIPPGTFMMGSPPGETGRAANEGPQTRVTVPGGFWLDSHEVTNAAWKAIMGTDVVEQARLAQEDETAFGMGSRRRRIREFFGLGKDGDTMALVGNTGGDIPIVWVSWTEACAFCAKLTARERAAGRLPPGCVFRLPTEAEWEYACRAGSGEATYGGPLVVQKDHSAPVLDSIAWYSGNSRIGYQGHAVDADAWPGGKPGMEAGKAGPRAVGTKLPNAWGLYDMLGNAAEWCLDWYGPLPGGSVTGWTGPLTGTRKVRKGGGWSSFAIHTRSAFRQAHEPGFRFINLGMRVALAEPVRQ